MLRMTDTDRKQEKIQHFKGHHIPKVLTVSSRCAWHLSEATCLLLPSTHTGSDYVSVRWCWNKKGVCLQFTTLSISCSTGLVETCPKHPSIQLSVKINITMAIAVLKWQKQSQRQYFLWFLVIVLVSFAPMLPWNRKIAKIKYLCMLIMIKFSY